MAKHDESKLPKWAQSLIADLRREVEESNYKRAQMAKANDVLNGKDWFTLATWGDDKRTFFVLRNDSASPICTLYGDDIMLVGRVIRPNH